MVLYVDAARHMKGEWGEKKRLSDKQSPGVEMGQRAIITTTVKTYFCKMKMSEKKEKKTF
ncbi:CLUMA_CG000427, isoform A [Clunio marinus]|uniref:CLUMA_CG000427, isoform A n=1 Tax=Clunio marinus TaxID=568069 RepID=A0A1J1HJE0_9DIPT|nr:CLUMA_CG000427, isoform A [Clunio marinus]